MKRESEIFTEIPLAGIGADVIVGFPGESDQDFEDTYAFINEMPLSYLHVFKFSERPGTPAEKMTGKVAFSIREKRSRRLIALSEKKHQEFCKLIPGSFVTSYSSTPGVKGLITGFTGNYLSTEYPWNSGITGKVIKVKLTGISVSGRMNVELVN